MVVGGRHDSVVRRESTFRLARDALDQRQASEVVEMEALEVEHERLTEASALFNQTFAWARCGDKVAQAKREAVLAFAVGIRASTIREVEERLAPLEVAKGRWRRTVRHWRPR